MNKHLNATFKMVAFAALLLFVVGCGSASTPTPSTPSIVGTWATTITQEEAPAFAAYIEITFSDSGRVLVLNPGVRGTTDLGSYTVTQDQLLVTDEWAECLKLGFPTAAYKWSVENDALTLTATDDRCYSRRKPWARTWSRKAAVGTPTPTIKPMLK